MPLKGRYGIPATGVLVAVLSITVVNPSAAGYVSVDGTSTSIGNYRAGQTVAQLATSTMNSEGSVQIGTSVAAHKVADLVGYFTDAETASTGATYHPSTARLLDTRTAGSGGRTTNGTARRIVARGVPAGAKAVAINITVVRPDAPAYATAWAAGARPVASVVNAVPGDVRSTRTIVPLAPDGSFQVAVVGGRSDLVVDLSGWFGGADGAFFQPATGRLADTRHPSYLWADDPFAWPVESAVRAVDPQVGAPRTVSADALTRPVAAWLTITVISGSRAGWTAATPTRGQWEDPQPPATTSDLNWGPGITANAVLTPTGTDGWVSLQGKQSNPPTYPPQADVLVDLSGIFVTAPPPSVTGLWQQNGLRSGSGPAGSFRSVEGFGDDVVTMAATSSDDVAALLSDGTVRLRRNPATTSFVLDTDAAQLVAADRGLYVRRRDGTVWTNDYSEGAGGVPGQSSSYRQVQGISDAADIAAYHGRAAAVLRGGQVVQWGGATSPQVTPVALAGPVRDISAGWSGLACVAYADGSVDAIRANGTRVHFDGVDAVEVATHAPDNSWSDQAICFARDSQNRLHWFGHYATGAESQRLIPGDHLVTAMSSITGLVSRGLTTGQPLVRVLDDAGHVYDLDAFFTWVHQPGLDGATVIGGGPSSQFVLVPGSA